MLPNKPPAVRAPGGLYSTAFHGMAQRLRNPLRLSTGDKRDAHAGFDKKFVTAPAVLQQRD